MAQVQRGDRVRDLIRIDRSGGYVSAVTPTQALVKWPDGREEWAVRSNLEKIAQPPEPPPVPI